MSAKIEKLEKSTVCVTLTIPFEEIDEGTKVAYEKNKNDIEIDGYRKGKVPFPMYVKKFGKTALYQDSLNDLIGNKYYDAVIKEDIQVVSQPNVELVEVNFEAGKSCVVKCTVAVKPEVTLGEYKGLEAEKMPTDVKDNEIKAEIDALLAPKTEVLPKEDGNLEKGDTAIFDFEGFVDGKAFDGGKAENHSLEIGSGQFIPGFEDQMIGMTNGEEKDINVTFPKEYHSEELKGKDAVFKVKLHEMKMSKKPELTDELVKELSEEEGVDTVDKLKLSIKTKLKDNKEKASKNKLIDTLVDKASENASVEIPEQMIQEEAKRLTDQTAQQAQQYGMELDMFLAMSGKDRESFDKEINEHAEKRVKYNLVIEAISKAEKVKATDKEVSKKYEDLAGMYNMTVDQLKAVVKEDALKDEVIFEKTFDLLIENATIK